MTTVPLFLRGLAVSALVLAMALDLQEETDFNNLVEPSDDDLLQVSLVQLDLQMLPVSGAGAHGPESEKVVISANGEVASAAAQHGAAGEQGDGKLTNLLQVKRDSESDGDDEELSLARVIQLAKEQLPKKCVAPKEACKDANGLLEVLSKHVHANADQTAAAGLVQSALGLPFWVYGPSGLSGGFEFLDQNQDKELSLDELKNFADPSTSALLKDLHEHLDKDNSKGLDMKEIEDFCRSAAEVREFVPHVDPFFPKNATAENNQKRLTKEHFVAHVTAKSPGLAKNISNGNFTAETYDIRRRLALTRNKILNTVCKDFKGTCPRIIKLIDLYIGVACKQAPNTEFALHDVVGISAVDFWLLSARGFMATYDAVDANNDTFLGYNELHGVWYGRVWSHRLRAGLWTLLDENNDGGVDQVEMANHMLAVIDIRNFIPGIDRSYWETEFLPEGQWRSSDELKMQLRKRVVPEMLDEKHRTAFDHDMVEAAAMALTSEIRLTAVSSDNVWIHTMGMTVEQLGKAEGPSRHTRKPMARPAGIVNNLTPGKLIFFGLVFLFIIAYIYWQCYRKV